jgi:molecular chaperone DnaK (HSP70)
LVSQPKSQGSDEGFVAFDFGTSFSRIAYGKGSGSGLVTDLAGDAGIPSLIAMSDKGGFLAGGAAKDRQSLYPGETVYSLKALLNAEAKTLEALGAFFPFAPEDGSALLQLNIGGRPSNPIELCSLYLAWLRRSAEMRLERPVNLAVITVPNCFSPFDRQSLKLAARLAGFQRVRLIEESIAAGLSWAANGGRGRVAACTWGAGFLNASIMEVQDKFVRILATAGMPIGGDYIDSHLALDFMAKVRESGAKIENEQIFSRHVLSLAEAAKRDIVNRGKADIQIKPAGGKAFKQTYTAEDLGRILTPLQDKAGRLIKRLMSRLNKEETKLDALVLTGGMMHIGSVTNTLEEVFGLKAIGGIDLEESAVSGALVRARLLDRLQSNLVVLDKLYAGLGLEGQDGTVTSILERGVPIPASSREQFTTFLDKQTDMGVKLYGQTGPEWKPIGQILLSKIPPLKAGTAEIEIQFTVDEDGVITVAATEKTKKKSLNAVLIPTRGLPNTFVEETLEGLPPNDEEQFASNLKGELQQRGHFVLESLSDLTRRRVGIMTRDERQLLDKKSKELIEVLEGADLMEMRSCVQELEEAARPLLQRDIDASLQTLLT